MESLNKENIDYYSHITWIVNSGNFNGICILCNNKINKKDNILIESDVSNGLVINRYCKSCGNKRLLEFSNYYKNMMFEF